MTTHVDISCGYFALGFNSDMNDNDMWAYYHDGSASERAGVVTDLFASGHNEPPEDEQQDYSLVAFTTAQTQNNDGSGVVDYDVFTV